MDFQPIILPLAAGAIAGAALSKKPDPKTQAELSMLKLRASQSGGLMLGVSAAVIGVAVLSLKKPNIGAGVLTVAAFWSGYSAYKAEAGSQLRIMSLAGLAVGGGLAATLQYGSPAAVKGAAQAFIGLAGASAVSTSVFLADVARMPNQLPSGTPPAAPPNNSPNVGV